MKRCLFPLTVDGNTDPSTEGSRADSAGFEPTKDRVTQLCPDEAQAEGHFVPKRGFLKVPSLCEPRHAYQHFILLFLEYCEKWILNSEFALALVVLGFPYAQLLNECLLIL